MFTNETMLGVWMKRVIFVLPFLLCAQEDFISDFEYGQMLYKNPRGVSCAACHGESGEGKEIIAYRDEANQTKVLRGADIRNRTLEDLEEKLSRDHPVMPKYYLTDEEVKAIYDYIQQVYHGSEGKNPK
jgi:mono/diheme cytochrome c family protein